MTAKIRKMTTQRHKYDTCVYVDNSVELVDFFEKSPIKPTVVPRGGDLQILQVKLQWY